MFSSFFFTRLILTPYCFSIYSHHTQHNRHCMSEMHQPNNFEIYRTKKECCKEHYASQVDECITKSTHMEGPHQGNDPFPWAIHFPGTKPWVRPFAPNEAENHWGTEASHRNTWFPDLHNKVSYNMMLILGGGRQAIYKSYSIVIFTFGSYPSSHPSLIFDSLLSSLLCRETVFMVVITKIGCRPRDLNRIIYLRSQIIAVRNGE